MDLSNLIQPGWMISEGTVVNKVIEEIPAELQPAADAALAWINRERSAHFKLTGLVLDDDGPAALTAGQAMELGLVLCQDDLCMREQVRVAPRDQGFEISAVPADAPLIPPHLDPPTGVRENWLAEQLGKYSFVVLLYYRGLW